MSNKIFVNLCKIDLKYMKNAECYCESNANRIKYYKETLDFLNFKHVGACYNNISNKEHLNKHHAKQRTFQTMRTIMLPTVQTQLSNQVISSRGQYEVTMMYIT